MSHDNTLRDEAGEMKPSNSRKAGEGSIIDPRSSKYPSTIELIHEATHSEIEEHIRARRPGGKFRKGHEFRPPICSCSCHPCICGTSHAKAEAHHKQY